MNAVRELREDERGWLAQHLALAWGSAEIVGGGRVRDASRLPAVVGVEGERLTGLATYELDAGACEIVTIEAFEQRRGIGSALLATVIAIARERGCDRVHLITTNDNDGAHRFYERHGFRLVAVHRGAVVRARAIKPEIPLRGENGVAIEDELEFELRLRPSRADQA